MKSFERQFGLVVLAGIMALAAALGYSMMTAGMLLSDNAFLVALRVFGLGIIAAGLTMWIAIRRDEAGKTSLNPLFLLVIGLLFPLSGLSHTAEMAGLGFALSGLVIGVLAMLFSPAYPKPIATRWPEGGQPETVTSPEHQEAVEGHQEPEPDDLTLIEGIGPTLQGILHAAGVRTFEQLATKQPEEIRQIVQAANFRAPFDPTTWPQQALLAARGEWKAFESLKEQLVGGRAN
jgi:predicted flap endonuclease-1-like 5' DNA nuclease